MSFVKTHAHMRKKTSRKAANKGIKIMHGTVGIFGPQRNEIFVLLSARRQNVLCIEVCLQCANQVIYQ